MAATRTLELTLISAKDLKDVNLMSKMEVYAVVSLSGDPRSRQRVQADRIGGRNPTWNATVRFNVPATGAGSLHVLLRAERALGDRDVGEVHIPLSELLSGAPDGPVPAKFVAYQVRKISSGKPQGVINLSYKLGEVTKSATANGYAPAQSAYTQAAAYPPPSTYPPPSGKANAYAPPAAVYPPPTAYPPAAKADAYPPPSGAYPPAAGKADVPATAYPVLTVVGCLARDILMRSPTAGSFFKCLCRKLIKSLVVSFTSINITVCFLLLYTFLLMEAWEFVVYVLSDYFLVSLLCSYARRPRWQSSRCVRRGFGALLWVKRVGRARGGARCNQLCVLGLRRRRLHTLRVMVSQVLPLSFFLGMPPVAVPKEVRRGVFRSLRAKCGGEPLSNGAVVLSRRGCTQLDVDGR